VEGNPFYLSALLNDHVVICQKSARFTRTNCQASSGQQDVANLGFVSKSSVRGLGSPFFRKSLPDFRQKIYSSKN